MLGSANKLKTARTISLSGVVSGSVSFDGNQNVTINTTQENIAVLTGSVKLAAASSSDNAKQTTWTLNFPSGFNKDNSICVAFGIKTNTKSGFAYGLSESVSTRMFLGTYFKSVQVGYSSDTSKIFCEAYNPATSERTIDYKIVLMKI